MTKPKGDDLMELGPELPCSRARPFVRRREPEAAPEFGVTVPLREGQPITDSVVHLEHRGPGDVYKVSNPLGGEAPAGPAKVTTDEYRTGWDRLFSSKPTVGQA